MAYVKIRFLVCSFSIAIALVLVSSEPIFKRSVIDFTKESLNKESEKLSQHYENTPGLTITNVTKAVMCFTRDNCHRIEHFRLPDQKITCKDNNLKIFFHTDSTKKTVTAGYLPQGYSKFVEESQRTIQICQKIKR
jgi:hypothetical protein